MAALERILVFTHGTSVDDPAVCRAFSIAKRVGAHLILLDATAGFPVGREALLATLEIHDAREEAERERRGHLSEMARILHSHGVHAEIDMRWGRPAVEVVREAVDRRCQLVVLEDDRALGLDAVSRAVVRQCPVPVWVVKTSPHAPPPRVLAAIDPVGEIGTMDDRLLDAASMAADTMGAELYVVHAWQPLQEELDWLPAGFQRMAEQSVGPNATHARHTKAVADLVAKKLPRLAADRVRVVEGSPTSVVLETIDEIGADLIVFGTARVAEYAGLILGKTADAIAERTPISILAVKPDGFVSPVH
jgi:universal stress protein E